MFRRFWEWLARVLQGTADAVVEDITPIERPKKKRRPQRGRDF